MVFKHNCIFLGSLHKVKTVYRGRIWITKVRRLVGKRGTVAHWYVICLGSGSGSPSSMSTLPWQISTNSSKRMMQGSALHHQINKFYPHQDFRPHGLIHVTSFSIFHFWEKVIRIIRNGYQSKIRRVKRL